LFNLSDPTGAWRAEFFNDLFFRGDYRFTKPANVHSGRLSGLLDAAIWALAAAPSLDMSAQQIPAALEPDPGTGTAQPPAARDLIASLPSLPFGNNWTA
jgi:hypothetical protein